MVDPKPTVILASGSRFRRRMLQAAGVTFTVVPAAVDEAALRQSLMAKDKGIDPAAVALHLARAKANDVSRANRQSIVIGCDQILAVGGDIVSKPPTLAQARIQLLALQGRSHYLHTAVVLAQHGEIVWSHMETAIMAMRSITPSELDRYLAAAGPGICETVGGYEFEGLGAQLFAKVEGDQFTIVGLPLLPLLAELRRRGVQGP